MAEGRSTPAEQFGLRAAAPYQEGPLGSSGAAPEGRADAAPAPAAPPAVGGGGPVGDVDPSAPAIPTQREPFDKPDSSAPPASIPRKRRNPVRTAGRGVKRGARSTLAWAKRPAGRLILPGVLVLLLVGAAVAAGAYYVPQKLKAAPAAKATPTFGAGGAAPVPSASLPSDAGLPVGGVSGQPTGGVTQPTQQVPAGTGQRPQEVLAGWAEQTGTKLGIPVVAVEAYGYAELVLARTTPTCHLSWTTLAAIAEVESNHGHFQNSVLGADGTVTPPIYGLPLDGQGGRSLIKDTDHGAIDGDATYDRAVGPLQFIPSTWLAYKVDADNNGIADPQNINDASLTAGIYLCQNGRDLSKPDDWYSAIFSYNAVQPYAQKVFQTANEYGQRSRT